MRCPKCYSETPPGAAFCPGCKLPTPAGRKTQAKDKDREFKKLLKSKSRSDSDSAGRRKRAKTVIRAAVLVVLVLVSGAIAYTVAFNFLESKQADPVAALAALDTLRALPSNKDGLTVDEAMALELKKARESGRLRGYQGWTTQRIAGTDVQVLIVFSYQDIDDNDYRAEWLADLSARSFRPQNDLARSVYSR